MTPKMHADEFDIDAVLVRRLLGSQFPEWSRLPVEPVPSSGTDNALYRLGEDLVVRLPRIESATRSVEKEQAWLPKLARHLPLPIPQPVALGGPGAGYPWQWSVYRWLDANSVGVWGEGLGDLDAAANDLAGFIRALWNVETTSLAMRGAPQSVRAGPLALRDAETRAAIASLGHAIDSEAAVAVWEAAVAAPVWARSPVWIHGDLIPSNLLAAHGRLAAVIDFGCTGLGDPACDLQPAWNLFEGNAREAFRAALEVDEATWVRGRGWSLSVGVIALPYYRESNPVLAAIALRAITATCADWTGTLSRR